MRIKNAIFSAVLIVSASLAFSVAAQTTAPSKSKVVLQVSEGDAGKWKTAIRRLGLSPSLSARGITTV